MKRLLGVVMIVMLLPVSAMAASVAAGHRIAKRKCAGCHGATGAGNGPLLASLGAPVPPVPWTDKAGMAKFTDQQITEVITHGGKALNASPLMPAFGNQLSKSQIANLVAYIRSLGK
jgi:high-affinity iron transporter